MKAPVKSSIWFFWLPLGLAIALFFVVLFVGNILVIGTKLGFFSPFLERGFYGLILVLFIWLIAAPLGGVLLKPVLALEELAAGRSNADHKKLKTVSRQLINAGILPPEAHTRLAGALGLGADLREPLAMAISTQRESAIKIIHAHAVRVFVSTAVCQSGRLDFIAVLITNFRLVRQLVKHFGYRPPLPTLIKIYAQIFLAALIADELTDLDVEGVLGHVGLGVLGAIPGTDLIVNSVFDGTINAWFTLRVGFVTRKCLLNAGSNLTRSEIRRVANQEARQELIPVLRDGVPVLPSAIKKLAQKLF